MKWKLVLPTHFSQADSQGTVITRMTLRLCNVQHQGNREKGKQYQGECALSSFQIVGPFQLKFMLFSNQKTLLTIFL